MALCTGIFRGGSSDFDHVFNEAKTTSDQALKNDLFYSLACSKNPLEHIRFFDYFKSENSSDVLGSLVNVANRPGGYVTSWNYLKSNWNYLYQK